MYIRMYTVHCSSVVFVPTLGAEDIYEENLKLILGLIWTLICHYQIRSSGRGISVKKAMLMRIQSELPEYGVSNFNTDMNDGRVLCGMVDNLKPGLCPHHFHLDRNKGIENCQLGLDLAQNNFGIPQILLAEDLNNPAIDDLSVMTYLSYFLPLSNKNLLAWLQKLLPQRNIKNLTTDWIDGVNFGALLDKLFSIFPDWEKMDPKNKADNMTRVADACKACLGLSLPLSVKVMTDPSIDEMSMSAIICLIKGATLKGGAGSFTLSLDREEVLTGEEVMARLNMDDEAKPELFHHLSVFGVLESDQSNVQGVQVEKHKEYLLYRLVPVKAGRFSVYAKFQDKNVKNSPRTLEVALKVGPPCFSLTVDNKKPLVDTPLPIQVNLLEAVKPEFLKKLFVCGKLEGSDEEVKADEVETTDSHVMFTLTPTAVGNFYIHVKFEGTDVNDSPQKLTVVPQVDPSCFSLTLDNKKPLVNRPLPIQVNLLKAVKAKFLSNLLVCGKLEGSDKEVKADMVETTDSHVMFTLTPTAVGNFYIHVKFEDTDVNDSPQKLTVVPHVSPVTFALRTEGNSCAIGEPLHLFVDVLEKNVESSHFNSLEIFGKMDGKQDKMAAKLVSSDESCLQYEMVPETVGVMRVSAQFKGTDVGNSPLVLQVNPALNERVRIATLPSPLVAKVRQPFSFSIKTDVPLKEKDLHVSVKCKDKEVPYKLTQNSPTDFTVEFVPTEPGQYSINVLLEGLPVKGAPFSLHAIDPSKCRIIGDIPEVLHVGDSVDLTVDTGQGSQLGDSFKCWAEGEDSSVEVELVASSDTEYTLTLTGLGIGLSTIHSTLGGDPIPLTPFTVSVVDSQLCEVDEDNWDFLDGILVEEQILVNINTEKAGRAKPEVYFEDSDGKITHATVYEKEKNKYCADTKQLKKESRYKMVIKLGGHPIRGSPWSFDVNAKPEAYCHVTGPGLTTAIAKKPAKFKVLSTETNAVKEGQLKVSVEAATGGYRGTVDITDNEDKTYTVTYTCPNPGVYLIKVIFYDEPAEGSPFKVNVLDAANASRCRAYGPALEPKAVIMSGEPTEFYVDASQAGTGKLMVVIRGRENDPNVYISDDGKGVYSVKFDIGGYGRYYANVWWGEKHIPGSPFPLNVSREPNPALVKAYGPGLSKRLNINDRAEITIETKNAGRGTLTIRVHGIKDTFNIQARQASVETPRTLVAEYHPNASGIYTIQIKWQDHNVPGSPFRVHVYDPDSESEMYEEEWTRHSESSEEDDYSDEEEKKKWRRRKQRRENRRRSREEEFYHGDRRPSWKTVEDHAPLRVQSTVSPGWSATPTSSKTTATKYYTSTPLQQTTTETHEAIIASEKHIGQRRVSWTKK